ncbi:hypothetical protein M8494_17780 [Serratia ureilytica]
MVLGIYDLTQQRHAICRNYPIIGRMRFFFEFIRPELRQYFLEQDNEEIRFRAPSARWCIAGRKTRWATNRSAPCWTSTGCFMSPSATPCGRWKPPTRPVSIFIGGADCRQPLPRVDLQHFCHELPARSPPTPFARSTSARPRAISTTTPARAAISRYHRENNGDLVGSWAAAISAAAPPTAISIRGALPNRRSPQVA